jgi:hypothetical protein
MYPYGSSIGDVPVAFGDCDNGNTAAIRLLPEFRFLDKVREAIYVSYAEVIMLNTALLRQFRGSRLQCDYYVFLHYVVHSQSFR